MGRRLGQHFLFQRDILDRIARAACPERVARLIEIGPGPGGLTAELASRTDELILVELDPSLAAGLREVYGTNPKVRVVEADVLQTNLGQWGEAVICGNLPYYITSPIIEQVLALGPLLQRAVFLVQREVGDRLAATPGSRDYGYLSVLVQAECRMERLFFVKPASFRPPPKVDSAVVRLTPRPQPLVADRRTFKRFISLCFRQKRKTLRNNLAGVAPREVLDQIPATKQRAEQLSLEELAGLLGQLRELGSF